MKYHEVLEEIREGKIRKMANGLLSGKKNRTLRMLRDYYNGNQWLYNGNMTNTTRSEREVWGINSSDLRDMGIREGDLQVWNVCDSTVNIYSSYGRGTINDSNKIAIEDKPEQSKLINDVIDVDTLVVKTFTRMSVDSINIWKFEPEKAPLFVDALEMFPVYDGDDKVGSIRVYEISPSDPLMNQVSSRDKKMKPLYIEIWIPDIDSGEMWLYKYVNDEKLEAGIAPYQFDPYIYVTNKDNEFVNFDENNIEVSDIAKLIPVQDFINKTVTEQGIIISKVAFPMIKVVKEAFEWMAEGKLDPETFKEDLAKLSIIAGKIISAPIEREAGQDMPSGVDKYLETLFEQVYRITGIPASIYVTDGIGNISEKTISVLMESLKRRVDEKRTNFEKAINQYIVYYFNDPEMYNNIEIQWAEMFAMSKEEISKILLDSLSGKALPVEYVAEELLHILGDEEKVKNVLAIMSDRDFSTRLGIEIEKTKSDLEKKTNTQIEAERKERDKLAEQLRKEKTDKAMLENELMSISSQL